ncbi:MAG TPA: hypothetical protein VGA55_07390 [Bacteroidota bacterium]
MKNNFKTTMSKFKEWKQCCRAARTVILIAILAAPASGQQPSVFDNCTDVRSVLFTKGSLVRIDCDSALLLNTLTFHLYDRAYRDLRSGGPAIENLMTAYDDIIALQEDRLKTQQTAYAELRQRFNDLSHVSESTLGESSRRLTQAVTSMETLNNDLHQTKELLGEARGIIESEKRVLNLEKILWGAGGLAAGIIAGVLIAR